MMRHLFIAALVAALVGASALRAQAGPKYIDGSFTIAASGTAATQAVNLASEAFEIDRIVVFNDGDVAAAATAYASDIGALTALESWSLAANAGQSRSPRRTELTYLPFQVVTNDVIVSGLNVGTNSSARLWQARDVSIVGTKATNATASVIYYRIIGFN